MSERLLRCFAYGDEGHWQAFCLDLNLAVAGRSLEEVRASLATMIRTYLEDVDQELPADRARLLHRRAPLNIMARYYLSRLWQPFDTGHGRQRQTSFELPCRA